MYSSQLSDQNKPKGLNETSFKRKSKHFGRRSKVIQTDDSRITVIKNSTASSTQASPSKQRCLQKKQSHKRTKSSIRFRDWIKNKQQQPPPPTEKPTTSSKSTSDYTTTNNVSGSSCRQYVASSHVETDDHHHHVEDDHHVDYSTHTTNNYNQTNNTQNVYDQEDEDGDSAMQ